VEALVKVEKVNPSLKTVYVRRLLLHREDEERTVVRFSLDEHAQIRDINQLQKRLAPYEIELDPGP
jgi:hypothetical protein